eukprot:1156227-Pelagomonas_calceolata.AAC.6
MDASRSPSHSSSITLALEEALKEAFLRTDSEFAADGSAAMVGSTAVVALVGSRKAWVANCAARRGWPPVVSDVCLAFMAAAGRGLLVCGAGA